MLGVVLLCILAAIIITEANGWLLHWHLKPDAHDEIYSFSLICDFLSLWLLMAPLFAYLRVGQVKKVEVIRGFYTAELIAEYFDQFWSGRDSIAGLVRRWRTLPSRRNTLAPEDFNQQRSTLEGELDARFRNIIVEDFGGGVYVVPALILVAIGCIVLFFGFAGGIAYAEALLTTSSPPVMPLGLRLDLVSVAAIFGAYTWVTADSITRSHQWTFHSSDLFWYALRLAIAVPLGQAIAAVATTGTPSGLGPFLAFVISMFSFDAIKKYLSAAATRLGNAPAGSPNERNDVVVTMAGVDETASDALRAEGIATIAQLTAVDPVRLSILTGLPFYYVLRLIDSAMLWTFFRDDTDKLRAYGLRGASALIRHTEQPTDLGTAAGRFTAAQTAEHAARQNADAAAANLATAKLATTAETLTLDAAQAALQQIQAEADQAAAAQQLADMQTRVANLQHVKTCQDAADNANRDRDAAAQATSDADAALRLVATKDALFAAIQTDVKINALGLSQATAQLTTDDYARFISRLLGAASAA